MKLKADAINFSFRYSYLQRMIRPRKNSVFLAHVERVRIASNVNVIGIIYGAQIFVISIDLFGTVISNSCFALQESQTANYCEVLHVLFIFSREMLG
jgi:hypothetical protein